MDNFPEITSFTISVLIVFVVILAKAAITHIVSHEPLRFFRFYCQRLAGKVNKSDNSAKQQKIAGLLAFTITIIPLLIIVWLFSDFILIPWLWSALLLYISLGGIGIFARAKAIAKSLAANQNYEAKQALKPYLLRESDNLSSLGLTKAAIEMQLLHSSQQLVGVCCYFLIAGPLGALAYRLLLETHYSWNIKQQRFKFFGLYINKLSNLSQWLPSKLMAMALLVNTIGQSAYLNWQLTKAYFFKINNSMILHLLALSLGCKLGGVAMYQGEKLRKVSYNERGKQPEITDIIHASTRIKQALLLLTIALIVTVAVEAFLLKAN